MNYRIDNVDNVYQVKVYVFGMWITIKSYTTPDRYWNKSKAEALYELLKL